MTLPSPPPRYRMILATALFVLPLGACSPEVGSPEWCKKMDNTPKGDWTPNDEDAYLKHCVGQAMKDALDNLMGKKPADEAK